MRSSLRIVGIYSQTSIAETEQTEAIIDGGKGAVATNELCRIVQRWQRLVLRVTALAENVSRELRQFSTLQLVGIGPIRGTTETTTVILDSVSIVHPKPLTVTEPTPATLQLTPTTKPVHPKKKLTPPPKPKRR